MEKLHSCQFGELSRPFSFLCVFALPLSAEQFILFFTTGIMWNGQKSRKPVPGVKFKRTAHSYCHKTNKVLLDAIVMLSLILFIQERNSLARAPYASSLIPPFPPSARSFKVHNLVVDNEKWRRRNLSVLSLPLCDFSTFSRNSSY